MTDLSDRYARQLLLDEIGPEGQRRLARARVLIVGVGGLGSPVALYLAAAGVGCLGLVDDDRVSVTNLQRQVLYAQDEVGREKVLCAARRLHALNGDIAIEPHCTRLSEANATQLIGRYDLVVDGTDNFATRYLISDTCAATARPYVYGAICGLDGQAAVLCHGRATYRTLHPEEAATLAMTAPSKAVLGVTPALVGSVEATQALQLICHFGSPLIDRLWTIDLRTLDSHIIEL